MLAKNLGLNLAISTEAYNIEQFEHLRYDIGRIRRGWMC